MPEVAGVVFHKVGEVEESILSDFSAPSTGFAESVFSLPQMVWSMRSYPPLERMPKVSVRCVLLASHGMIEKPQLEAR